MRAYLAPFNELARRTDAAVVGIHHCGKYANTKLGSRARDLAIGSTAWVDCCRWADDDGALIIRSRARRER